MFSIQATVHAQPLVDGAVPLGVALGEVIVHRHEVDVLAGQGVEVERRARDEGLALTGLHLRDVALVEGDAAHQLDVEQALPRLALTRLADGCEGLVEDLVERLAVLDALPELGALRAELVVRQRLEVGLEGRDVGGLLGEPLEPPPLPDPEDLLEASEARRGHGLEGTVSPACRLRRSPAHILRTVSSSGRHAAGGMIRSMRLLTVPPRGRTRRRRRRPRRS